MQIAEILLFVQVILYVLGLGGLVYWLVRQIRALKGTLSAQGETIRAQTEGMKAQAEILTGLEGLLKTMDTLLKSTDEPKMLERLRAYKDFVDHEKEISLQAITETKQTFEQLIRSAGEAIISVDRVDRILSWNPAAERILGASEVDMLGKSIIDILPESAYTVAKAQLSLHHPVQSLDLQAVQLQSGPIDLAVTLSILPGSSGELKGLIAIVRDSTARREQESLIRQAEKLTALG